MHKTHTVFNWTFYESIQVYKIHNFVRYSFQCYYFITSGKRLPLLFNIHSMNIFQYFKPATIQNDSFVLNFGNYAINMIFRHFTHFEYSSFANALASKNMARSWSRCTVFQTLSVWISVENSWTYLTTKTVFHYIFLYIILST